MAGWQVVLVAVLIAAGVGLGWTAARAPGRRRRRPPPDGPHPAPVPRRPIPKLDPGGPTPAARATPVYGPAWHPSGIFGNLARDRWRSGPGLALFVQLEVEELPSGDFRLRRRSIRATGDIEDSIHGRVQTVNGPADVDPGWPPVTGDWIVPATLGATSRNGPAVLRDLLLDYPSGGAGPLPRDVEATLSAYFRETVRPPGPLASGSAAPLLYVAALAIRVGTDSAAVRLACARSVLRDPAVTLAHALLDRDDGTPALMSRRPTPVHAR